MKHTILFVAANPRDTDQLALQDECAAIERELRMTAGRDDFELRPRWAVSVDDLMRHLNELSPTVVHFSAHGTRGPASAPHVDGTLHRDIESPLEGGIVLQDQARSQHVSVHALATMIACASRSTRLVVLNACYSAVIADSLCDVVDCVVGIDGPIEDSVARSFAVAFYRALGNRCAVGNAVDQATATLRAKRQPDHLIACRTRDGISADETFLVAASRPSDPREPSTVPGDAAGHALQRAEAKSWSAATEGQHYDLFLAYPSANRSSARALHDLLQSDVRVFFAERSLQPSDRWDQEILAAQRASRATVLMISRQSDAAWYLSDEIITAIGLHRASPGAHRLVPVLLERGIAMPYCIGRVAALDATAAGGLERLADWLRGQVEQIRRQPAPLLSASGPASGVRARSNHFRLYDQLVRLSDSIFEQVVSDAGIEREMLASRTAALAERALDVAQLAALDPALARRISVELDRRAPWTRS